MTASVGGWERIRRVTAEEIMDLWAADELDEDGDRTWNMGMEYALTIDEIMAGLGNSRKNTAEWREQRAAVHTIVCSTVIEKFLLEKGLYFGTPKGASKKKGRQVPYFIARTADELSKMHLKKHRSLESKKKKVVQSRLYLQKIMHALPARHTQQRGILERTVKKRLPSL
jgi:hypothetical protein